MVYPSDLPIRRVKDWIMAPIHYVRNAKIRGFEEAGVPIVVYQMGKVGSMSITKSLQRRGVAPVYHVHQLHLPHLRELNQARKESGRPERDHRTERYLYQSLIEGQRRSKYISLVRDPVSRNVSAFFQNLRHHLAPGPYEEIPPLSELVEFFVEVYDHDVPLTWFQKEVEPVLGIDVYEEDFPKEEGYKGYKNDKFEIIVMKCEVDDSKKELALQNFLGVDDISLQRANVSAEKSYSDVYRRVKASVLPKAYVQRLCESDYMQHFYTENEIERIYDFWT